MRRNFRKGMFEKGLFRKGMFRKRFSKPPFTRLNSIYLERTLKYTYNNSSNNVVEKLKGYAYRVI